MSPAERCDLVGVKLSQRIDYTEAGLLGFSNDFGVTVIRHQNADAMVLASARLRGILYAFIL